MVNRRLAALELEVAPSVRENAILDREADGGLTVLVGKSTRSST